MKNGSRTWQVLIFKTLCADIDIWVAFGAGKHFMYYRINYICHMLGEDKSLALPVFHSFTGSDTTSAFFGRGKKWHGQHGIVIRT